MSTWLVMIIFHTVCALISFVSGIMLLSPKKVKRHPALMKIFILSLIGMIAFMIFATVSHWNELGTGEQIAFSLLPFLGVYMLYRGMQAVEKLNKGEYVQYVDDIGFGLISLFNGFIIVALIDLHAPPIIIPVVAIVATLIGSRYIKTVKSNLKSNVAS